MTRRTIVVDSEIWKVYPTGRITVYGKDEFGLLFELGTGPERKRRPRGAPPPRSCPDSGGPGRCAARAGDGVRPLSGRETSEERR